MGKHRLITDHYFRPESVFLTHRGELVIVASDEWCDWNELASVDRELQIGKAWDE